MNAVTQIIATDTSPSRQQDQADMLDLPMASIHRSKTINPRRSRNKTKFENMCESVKRQGVFQPIIVRPSPTDEGMYEVVAGDTRFEANQLAGHETILAVVRQLSDVEAKELAASENLDRSDLSVVEESWIAADMMNVHNQDHQEVAKRLGWEMTKLKGRLLLSHCIDEVSLALTNEEILLGHAEICANLKPREQQTVLRRIKETGWSVKEARNRLRTISPILNEAVFNTTDCEGCRHNSASNRDLFSSTDTVKESACYNKECWERKTEEAIQRIATEAKEEYGTVFFDTEISSDGYNIVSDFGDASGSNAVGEQQFTACMSCQHYGAIIETGYKRDGKLIKDTCFNLECFKQKVDDYKAVMKEINAAPSTGSSSSNTSQDNNVATVNKTKTAAKKAGAPSVRKGVKQAAFKRFANATELTIQQQPLIALALAALTMIEKVRKECSSNSYATEAVDQTVKEYFPNVELAQLRGDYTFDPLLITTFAEGTSEKLSPLMIRLASLLAHKNDIDLFEKSTQGKMNLGLLTYHKVNMKAWLAVDKEYLDAQTKGAINMDCKDSGFAECYDEQHDKGAFSDLAKQKLPEIKTAILSTEFDWTGYEPNGFKLSDYVKAPEPKSNFEPALNDTMSSANTDS